jgi:hypothetical protein
MGAAVHARIAMHDQRTLGVKPIANLLRAPFPPGKMEGHRLGAAGVGLTGDYSTNHHFPRVLSRRAWTALGSRSAREASRSSSSLAGGSRR